jgi:DNA mismatch repair ATPase MutL
LVWDINPPNPLYQGGKNESFSTEKGKLRGVWFEKVKSETDDNIHQKFYSWSWTKFKSYSPYTNLAQNPKQSQIKDAINFTKETLTFWKSDNWMWRLCEDFSKTQQNEEESIEMWRLCEETDLHFTKLWKIVWQAHNSYIIVETSDWIKFFDQHALAERINYEKLINVDKKISSQRLLLWESMNITPFEANFLVDNVDIFKEMWFDFELMPWNIVILNWIPDFIKKENVKDIFLGVLEDIWNSGLKKSKTLDEVRNKIFAYTACRSAIKFGNKLNLFEMNKLLNDSVETYSSTCPHWRPVVFEINLKDLKWKYER